MKIVAQRTFLPFDNRGDGNNPSISPLTNKSVMPANNVPTIESILGGETSIRDLYPDANGDWGKGEDDFKSYKEKGDDYKRMERDLDILKHMLGPRDKVSERWVVKVRDGDIMFESFPLAEQYMREHKIPFKYLTKAAQNKSVAIVSQNIDKVFMVESIDYTRGVKESGSAFCIRPNEFLTCAHVVKKYDKHQSHNLQEFLKTSLQLVQNGKKYNAEVKAVDPILDIALLKADISVDPFIIDPNIKVAEPIITIGSPHGFENNVSVGNVGSLNRRIYTYPNAPNYMFVDLSIFPGNSGGPVIKEENGHVIGIVTLIVSILGGYGLNAALPTQYINEFLKANP